jgi:DNA-directed RNA polymerase specialized sigma subunit
MLSLDATRKDDDGEDVCILDCIASPESILNEIILDQLVMQQLLKRLEELMPEAIEIGKLRQEGLSDEAIADIIGIKRTTFLSRLKKAEEKLREEYGPDFNF